MSIYSLISLLVLFPHFFTQLLMDVYLVLCLTQMTNEKLREQFTLQVLRS